MLASIGNFIAPIFAPLGFGNWQSSVATVTGLVAKENVVSTFGTLFHYTGELSENGAEIFTNLQAIFTPLSAFSFMLFNLLWCSLLCRNRRDQAGNGLLEMDVYRGRLPMRIGLCHFSRGLSIGYAVYRPRLYRGNRYCHPCVCHNSLSSLLLRPNRLRNTNRLSSVKANS